MNWLTESTTTVGQSAFEWWAYIWIPAAVGLASLSVALVSLLATHTANRIAREAVAHERARDLRQERFEFSQKLLRYLESRDLGSAKESQWATALSSDDNTWHIVRWSMSQAKHDPQLNELVIMEIGFRLQGWVRTGTFDFSDVLGGGYAPAE